MHATSEDTGIAAVTAAWNTRPKQAGVTEAMAFGVFAQSEEYPKPVLLEDYVGSMRVIRDRVMERARREGFKGDFVERMAELGWWIERLYTTSPNTGDGVTEAMVERAEAARQRFWETDSNYPETEAEFDADPAKYDKLAMRAALQADIDAEGDGNG